MSARQKFLADLASRRFDDSDSDGSSSFSSSSVDEESAASDAYDDEVDFDEIDDTSLADQLLKVTPPRNALPESDGAAYIERVKPLFREQSHSSNLRKQISVNYAESKPAPTKAELTPTISVIPQVPSSPLLRRAESFRRNKTQPNTPTRHMRSFSHDINERRMVNRPNLSKSVSMSSSFAEINDDLSAVTSVISTASINSALGVPISTSKKSSTVQPRREHLPRRPTSGGSNINAATSKNFVKRSDTEDTSTEATEVTSSFSASLSLSHSKSFESSTSKCSASKELERLKRLSIGGKKMDKNYAACDATEEGFELQVDFSKSDVSENSSDVSSIFWSSRGRQIDRTNKVSQISPATSGKKALNPGRMSLKDLKMKRYGGSESVASEHERSTGDDNRNSSSLMKSSSAKERSNSMPPLQSVLSRSKVPCERSKMSAPLEASISSSNLSRDERRRGRSITRSSDVIVPPSPPSLRSSSTPRPAPNSPLRRNSANALSRTPPRCTSNRNRDASPALPTNVLASRTSTPKTPPRMKACSDIPPPSPSSPSMNSRHKYRSGFQSSHEGARHRSPSPGPKRESIFQVLKPSKLASLSISVLSKAALPIQSLARSYIAKLRIENRRKNIVVMQSLIRRWICVRYYKSARTIALKCQGVYRGMIARDQLDFRHYCATRIQAVCRGFLGSIAFIDILRSIILIQSLLRMHYHRKRYLAFINETSSELAATLIQKTFRRYSAQTQFMMDLSDVIVCQSAVRRHLAMKRWTQLKSAIIIQATWRRFLASEYYILTLSDVIVCQSVARRKIAETKYNDLLARRYMAAVSIQKVHRGFSKRWRYQIMVAEAITIQSIVRRIIAMKELSILRQRQWSREEVAATKIQAAFVGYIARVDYAIMIGHVITLQRAVRSMMAKNDLHARRWYALEEGAATKIQAAYHGHTTRMAYVETICNAITLQSAVRSMIAKNKMRALRQVNSAATKIRAAYMGFITRMNYLITLDSVIICQCAIRAMQARRRLNEARLMKMSNEYESATKIQSAFRGYAVRIEYIITVSSIITCQSAVRTLLAKIELKELQQIQWAKEDSAATLIRAAYLGFTARMNYIFTVADIITIQRYARGHNARSVANELRVKKRIRQMAAEELEKTREEAAIKIQKVFRGFVVYEFAISSLANAIYIQANIRKFLAKLELERRRKLRLLHLSATRIQSSWRSFSAQTSYGLAIYGIISIQSIHRCKLAMAKYQTAQAQRFSAAVTLQCCFRRYLVISRLNRLAEVRAMHGGRIIMNAEKTSSAVIQNKWRHFLMQRNMRMRIDLENRAATAIQKCFRGYRDCLQFVVMTFSIIQIQAAARSYRAKLQLKQLKREKDDLDRKHDAAAIVIQSSFRGYREFVRFVLIQYFVIKIQSCARCYNCRRNFKQQLEQIADNKQRIREKKAALIIERFFITIKAEIDLEISRLETKKPSQQKSRKGDKAMKRQREQSDMKWGVSCNSSAFNTMVPSQFHPSPQSYPSGNASVISGGLDSYIMRGMSPGRGRMKSFQSVASAPNAPHVPAEPSGNASVISGGPGSHRMRGMSPGRGRMPSYQSVASAPHRTAESYAMRNNVSSLHAEQRVIDHYHPHNGVRHKTPPREQIYLVQSKENEGGIAHQTALHSGPDMNHSHPHRRDMRSASPSRELLMPMQNGGHYPSNLFTSGHSRVPPFQPGLAPQNSMTSDAVQHGGYEMWGPSPSYDSRLPPANHPPFYNANLPQSHGHPPYYDANMQHAHSLAHSNQRLNQYFASNQSVTNHVEPHANGSPVPPRSHYVMGAVPSRSQQSVSGPVQSSYPGHQRHPPVQNGLPPTQHAKYYSIE